MNPEDNLKISTGSKISTSLPIEAKAADRRAVAAESQGRVGQNTEEIKFCQKLRIQCSRKTSMPTNRIII